MKIKNVIIIGLIIISLTTLVNATTINDDNAMFTSDINITGTSHFGLLNYMKGVLYLNSKQ